MRIKILTWPESPNGFDQHGLALILLALPTDTSRVDARRLAREVLQKTAARLMRTAKIKIIETPSGPAIADGGLHISLSYAADKALIGLSCERSLGVDIVRIEHLPEIDALTRLYLPTPHTISPADFALAWARLEACCKALGLPLAEIDEDRQKAYAACDLPQCTQIDGYRMAVALAP